MASQAHVSDIQAIETFARQLTITGNELQREIETIQVILDQITRYIEVESVDDWKRRHLRASEQFSVARQALSRCEQVAREEDRRSCLTEKKELARAKQRVEFCESRLRGIRNLQQQWKHERSKIDGQLKKLIDISETNVPHAAKILDALINTLSEYSQLSTPESPR